MRARVEGPAGGRADPNPATGAAAGAGGGHAVGSPEAWSRSARPGGSDSAASAAVYATLIVTFGFQVARVEGLSMAPTLEDQDRLIVNKLAYRMHAPQVGDIVMLFYPLDPDKSFVKRVVAEPGDTIKSVRGRVYRNDVPLPDDFIPEEYRSEDSWGPEVIPEGYYFVMGDHRNNSSDSRTWKYVPKKYIIGKVQLRWWPIDTARIF
jgi:signal peptidase I